MPRRAGRFSACLFAGCAVNWTYRGAGRGAAVDTGARRGASGICIRWKRPHLHESSKYKMPLGKVMCWVCMAFFAFVLVLLTLEADTREALMVTPIWFIVLGLGWMFLRKNKLAK